jgi:cysteinyl-tRNA synthetase
MAIKIYNTLSSQKEEFKPIIDGNVGIYSCGPTVYDNAHIGNLRSFLLSDIIRRVFEYNKFNVNQVMNITDIDDKTINRSKEKGISLNDLTRHYEAVFLGDLHSLNILSPKNVLRATDHIEDMINMISVLLENNIAYQSKDGIYFSIASSPNYGELAKLNFAPTDSSKLKERISNDEYEKENPRDFVLWKFATPEDNGNTWPAPFGEGRPGWHIECSAMSTRALGPTIDIHTGGTDLIFPHHTNEIAQSEASTGKHFVNYWVHGAFMNINDNKMSKSKGNFMKLSDVVDNNISPLAFRYWLLTSHYRTQVNFTIEALQAAQNAYIRLIETFVRLQEVKHEHIHAAANPRNYKQEFLERINDDFNMPEAIALTWELIKDHGIESKEKVDLLLTFDQVLGLGLNGIIDIKQEIPPEITALAEIRDEARKNKEWDKADALRKEIEERGYEIKDNNQGNFDIYKK